jgi:hypothetical protein
MALPLARPDIYRDVIRAILFRFPLAIPAAKTLRKLPQLLHRSPNFPLL